MLDNKVVRQKEVVGEYQRCFSCGRIYWEWRTEELKREINEKTAQQVE
jgi:uncharacterized protein with PIN domain